MFSAQFSVYDNEGSQYKKEEFTDQELDTEKDNWGFGTFLKHGEILHNGLLKDGRFKLLAKVWVGQKGEERTVTKVVKPDEKEQSISKKIMNKFEEMWVNKELVDVKIVCEGRAFDCHKVLLAAQSPVFKAAFENDTKEAKERKLEIEDLDSDTVEEMIKYMYSEKIDNIEMKSMNLLVAADKYDLPGLKKLCEESLMASVSTETVLDVFVFADVHNAERLKKMTKALIVQNGDEVVKQSGWKEKLGRYQSLVFEVFEAAVSKT